VSFRSHGPVDMMLTKSSFVRGPFSGHVNWCHISCYVQHPMGREALHNNQFPLSWVYNGVHEVRSFDLPPQSQQTLRLNSLQLYIELSLGYAQPSIPIPNATCTVLPESVSPFLELGTNRVMFQDSSSNSLKVSSLPPDDFDGLRVPEYLPLFSASGELLSDPFPWQPQAESDDPTPKKQDLEVAPPTDGMTMKTTVDEDLTQHGMRRTELGSPIREGHVFDSSDDADVGHPTTSNEGVKEISERQVGDVGLDGEMACNVVIG
jgi:hypothetical protein